MKRLAILLALVVSLVAQLDYLIDLGIGPVSGNSVGQMPNASEALASAAPLVEVAAEQPAQQDVAIRQAPVSVPMADVLRDLHLVSGQGKVRSGP